MPQNQQCRPLTLCLFGLKLLQEENRNLLTVATAECLKAPKNLVPSLGTRPSLRERIEAPDRNTEGQPIKTWACSRVCLRKYKTESL
mmetsp:Transcript_19971/g.46634  ORF Transcript_19971/g.46634 Transcript_19971/m.46634 type:complete len:87 (-) Transcript_19971:858-1118(-)